MPNKSVPLNQYSKNAAAMMNSASETTFFTMPLRNFSANTARMIMPMNTIIESAILLKIIHTYLIVDVYSKLHSDALRDCLER